MAGKKWSKEEFLKYCFTLESEDSNGEDEDDNEIEIILSDFSEEENEDDIDDNDEDAAEVVEITSDCIGRDGTSWFKVNPHVKGKCEVVNILKGTPGPTAYTKRNLTFDKKSAWDLLVTEKMMTHIQKCTEAEASRRGEEDWKVSLEELYKFIAVLYARGANGCRGVPINDLWSLKWGLPFFNQTIARHKYREIMNYLRFDERSTRSERLKSDKFALISDIWEEFIENCKSCYIPTESITIGEQLCPAKTRCRFLQYMPNKPDKFGINFWIAVDANTKYLLNAKPYLGKDEHRPEGLTLGEHAVLSLARPFFKMGRNITTGNFFTSLNLGKILLNEKTTLVGTMRSNRKELPPCALSVKSELYSSKFFMHEDALLTIYRNKPKKNVIVLSTQHRNVYFKKGKKLKPSTIEYYNAYKCGANLFDAMLRRYSVRGETRRWPIHVFCHILDLAAINAWILYKETLNIPISRREFILELCEELSKSNSEDTIDQPPMKEVKKLNKRKRCQIKLCPKNNSSDICIYCKKVVCGSCARFTEKKTIVICKNC